MISGPFPVWWARLVLSFTRGDSLSLERAKTG